MILEAFVCFLDFFGTFGWVVGFEGFCGVQQLRKCGFGCSRKYPLQGGWLFFGVFGDIFGVAPNHDEHHGGFVDETDDDGAADESDEETCKATTNETEGDENYEDGGDVVDNLEDWLDPHNFEGEEIFEPKKEFVFGCGFGFDEEKINQNTADDCQNGGNDTPVAGATK